MSSQRLSLSDSGLHKNCCMTVSLVQHSSLAAGRLDYNKHLLLLQSADIELSGLAPFYTSAHLHAWQILNVNHDIAETPGLWLFEKPLLSNSFIGT